MMTDTDLKNFSILLLLTSFEYVLVFFMVIADLISGVKRSKKAGIKRTYSYGFRKTVDKLGGYYLPLIALTIIDCMQILSAWYLDKCHNFTLPTFPIMTLIGSIGIGLIEIKSILENAKDKVEFEKVGDLAVKVIKNKDDVSDIAEQVVNYLKDKQENEDNKGTIDKNTTKSQKAVVS